MTKSLDWDVIIDAWLQSGLQESLCFPYERLSLEITFSPSDSTIYRIVKRVFLKMLIKQFILSVDALLYAFTVLKNGIKLARSILYGFCGFKRYLHERNLFEFRINRPWNWGLVHFAYIIADIVSFRWWKLCSCWSKEQHNGI